MKIDFIRINRLVGIKPLIGMFEAGGCNYVL
jgi:hypothetical protein